MSKDFVFSMNGLSKTYPPGKQVLKDIYLSFYYGAKIGVIGLNGAGKSTLLKIMAGLETEFEGEAFPGKGTTVGFLPQEPKLDEKLTVKENVARGKKEVSDLLAEYEKVSGSFTENMKPEAMEKALARQSDLQEKIEAVNGWELDHQLEIAMDALRCPPSDSPVTHLSGGEKRRVALCKLLLQAPDLLLLDEPTNHLDAAAIGTLMRNLRQLPQRPAILLVSHDPRIIEHCDRMYRMPADGSGVMQLERTRENMR